MTKAASKRDICLIKAVLFLCEHGYLSSPHPPIILGLIPDHAGKVSILINVYILPMYFYNYSYVKPAIRYPAVD